MLVYIRFLLVMVLAVQSTLFSVSLLGEEKGAVKEVSVAVSDDQKIFTATTILRLILLKHYDEIAFIELVNKCRDTSYSIRDSMLTDPNKVLKAWGFIDDQGEVSTDLQEIVTRAVTGEEGSLVIVDQLDTVKAEQETGWWGFLQSCKKKQRVVRDEKLSPLQMLEKIIHALLHARTDIFSATQLLRYSGQDLVIDGELGGICFDDIDIIARGDYIYVTYNDGQAIILGAGDEQYKKICSLVDKVEARR